MSALQEAKRVWDAIAQAESEGHRVCLLTVTQVTGSAYRRPGARMMMADNGKMAGTLSGGCLEGDLYQYAKEAMQIGEATVRHYDLTEDDLWGLGIGCQGQIDVHIEPVTLRHPFWQAVYQALKAERPFGLAVQVPRRLSKN